MKEKKSLSEIYDNLPKEVKVLPYLVFSASLAALAEGLKVVKFDNPIYSIMLAGFINLLLVFVAQLKPRVTRLLEK